VMLQVLVCIKNLPHAGAVQDMWTNPGAPTPGQRKLAIRSLQQIVKEDLVCTDVYVDRRPRQMAFARQSRNVRLNLFVGQ